jgi:hypothetical protein
LVLIVEKNNSFIHVQKAYRKADLWLYRQIAVTTSVPDAIRGTAYVQQLCLTLKGGRIYSPKYLVFGKAVRVRHYPVTVSTENLSRDPQPLEAALPGRRSKFD